MLPLLYPLAELVEGECSLAHPLRVLIPARSRVGFYLHFFLASARHRDEVGVDDLQKVENVGQDRVRLDRFLPACRLVQISRERAVCSQVLYKRSEGAPRQSSPDVFELVVCPRDEVIRERLGVFICELREADYSPRLSPPTSSFAFIHRWKTSSMSEKSISSTISSPM